MEFKTITYQRLINTGNHESRRLEVSVELHGENAGIAITSLVQLVEHKVREPQLFELDKEITDLKDKIRELSIKKRCLQSDIANLESILESAVEAERLAGLKKEEPDPDDIPFEVGNIP